MGGDVFLRLPFILFKSCVKDGLKACARGRIGRNLRHIVRKRLIECLGRQPVASKGQGHDKPRVQVIDKRRNIQEQTALIDAKIDAHTKK